MIIGAPPEKRGATFADVPVNDIARRHKTMLRVMRVRNEDPTARNARCLESGDLVRVEDDEAVDLLTFTPVEPGPDPEVTTYPQLEEGQWFELTRSGMSAGPRLMCNSLSRGHMALPHNDFVTSCGQYDDEPVRVLTPLEVAAHILEAAGVSASVVVHEEPGPHASVVEGVLCWRVAKALTSWGDAEHLVRQLAALLAQRDARQAGKGGESS